MQTLSEREKTQQDGGYKPQSQGIWRPSLLQQMSQPRLQMCLMFLVPKGERNIIVMVRITEIKLRRLWMLSNFIFVNLFHCFNGIFNK